VSMREAKQEKFCPICSEAMQNKICTYTYYCEGCGYWAAFLQPNINSQDDFVFSEERNDKDVLSFLDKIRIRNFNLILDKIDSRGARDVLNILDVGCASGLFLKIAGERGHITTGIEPNPVMAKIALGKGFDVVNGYFPDAIQPTSKFDLIIFNDVFEHIPDLNEILNSCNIFLNDGGMLIISLPNSGGIFFRLAKLLAMVGALGPWDRLWQVMFYTPHLHYFCSGSLDSLLKKHDFENKSEYIEIEAVSLHGLWDRHAIDSSRHLLSRIFMYIGIVVFYPITKLFQQDAFFSIYEKRVSTTSQRSKQ